MRPIRPVTIPTTIQIQSPNATNPVPNISNAAVHGGQTSTVMSTMPLINNPNIRVRLPDTPTPPNLLQQASPNISQQCRLSIASSMAASGAGMQPTISSLQSSVQLKGTQQPKMVTIQGHQVILNPQVGMTSTAQVVPTNASGAGTLMASNTSGAVLTAVGPSHQISSSANTIVQHPALLPQQKVVQVRPQQITSGGNIVVGNSPNIFRVPTPTGVASPAATVIVNASGVSGQAGQLPQAVMVNFTKLMILSRFK